MSTSGRLGLILFAAVGVAALSARADEIHRMAALGDYEKVKAILERRAELVTSRDGRGWQPIHHAAFSGRKEVIEILLQYKADINARLEERHPAGYLNFTPLHMAAKYGRVEVVEYLIEKGADIEAKDAWDQTPLFLACLEGEVGVLQVLVDHKADVNVKNKLGKTPLQRAIEAENKKVIQFLRANGAVEQ